MSSCKLEVQGIDDGEDHGVDSLEGHNALCSNNDANSLDLYLVLLDLTATVVEGLVPREVDLFITLRDQLRRAWRRWKRAWHHLLLR